MLMLLQQQNQTNRDRVMEGQPWGSGGSAPPPEKGEARANANEYPDGSGPDAFASQENGASNNDSFEE